MGQILAVRDLCIARLKHWMHHVPLVGLANAWNEAGIGAAAALKPAHWLDWTCILLQIGPVQWQAQSFMRFPNNSKQQAATVDCIHIQNGC